MEFTEPFKCFYSYVDYAVMEFVELMIYPALVLTLIERVILLFQHEQSSTCTSSHLYLQNRPEEPR